MTSEAVQPILVLLSDTPGGNPTQYMIEKAFAQQDLDWRYLTVEVHPEHLAAAVGGIRALGFRGGHCGPAHKVAVLPLLDRASPAAEMVGAVNVICRDADELVGENTEGKGLLEALRTVTEPADKRIVLLGAGWAARAVAVELAAEKPAHLTVVNRTEHRGRDLVELLTDRLEVSASLSIWQGDFEVPGDTDVLIHATTIGQEAPDARVAIVPDSLPSRLVVADLIADPPRTWLLREAAARGCPTLDGLTIYVHQVAWALKLWTGVEADRDVMREAVEEFLEV